MAKRKTKQLKEDSDLYPIKYRRKLYYKKDCDPIFQSFYTCKEALNEENGAYMTDGIWVYPDGKMSEW